VFNSAQGMFIFLFHCVFNKQVRKEDIWRLFASRLTHSNVLENTSFYVFQMREVVHDSIAKRSSLSTSFGTKPVGRSKSKETLFSVLTFRVLYFYVPCLYMLIN
jgi:hypothetical protein